MKSIVFFTIILLVLEYGLGYGLARRILPKNLTKYALAMGPWILNVCLIILLVVTSLLGIPAQPVSIGAFVGLLMLSVMERKTIRIGTKELLIWGIVGVSVIMNNSPLLLKDRFLTSISMGNNDIITYAINSDYLVNNSIADSFRQPVTLTVANLLHDGYRWGTPILQSFFLTITQTKAWQITFLMQTILFATMLPLLYVLFELWYDKDKLSWWPVVLGAFNANLLYMMYHNFYGQVVYWGILLIITIFSSEYFASPNKKLEWLVGASIAAMYMAYHEPATFVLVPLVITGLITRNWRGLLRIAGITALLAGLSVINAFIFDFGQAFKGNPNQPIGWQIFRAQSATSNPFEMSGMSSVHTNTPLPIYMAWGLSIFTVIIWILGIKRSGARIYTKVMMGFFLIMLFWTSLGKNGNWFVFNRAMTYVLPVMLVVLAGGILSVGKKHFRIGMITLISILVIRTGLKLNWKLINSHLSVNAWYPTLLEVRKLGITEPIYTAGMMSTGVSLWDQVWTGYFLYPSINDGSIPITTVSDGSYTLLNKSTPWVKYPSYAMDELLWENDYYKFGRVCLSDVCLSNYSKNLSQISFGESEYEDNLLLLGWSLPEKRGRWILGKEASLKLITTHPTNNLLIEVESLVEPQEMNIQIDGIEVGTKSVIVTKESYVYELPSELDKGVHTITLKFANSSKPSTLLGNQDQRELSGRLFFISLE